VDSTAIANDYQAALQAMVNDIIQYQHRGFLFEIYRGDSFQALIPDPTKALLISVILRAGLRRNSRGKSIEEAWDARISIGIGNVDNENVNNDTELSNTRLSTRNGEAFIRSGRTLDAMKKQGARLRITTGDSNLDQEFEAACSLADTIISRWTTNQAEAIYLYLLKGTTQKEIGQELQTTQRAISKRLEASSLDSMTQFFNRYKEVIEWKLAGPFA
jgi:hypothetical protein